MGWRRENRGWLLEAVAVGLVLLGCWALGTKLRHDPEWTYRPAGRSIEPLTDLREGGLESIVIPGAVSEPTATLRLPPIEVEGGRRYLLTVTLQKGRSVTLGGVERPGAERLHLRFPARGRLETYSRLLQPGESTERLLLVLVTSGREAVEIESLTLVPLSRLPGLLRSLLPYLALAVVLGFFWRRRRELAEALGDSPRGAHDAVVAWILLFALCFAFHRFPVQQVMDARTVTAVSHGLVRYGTLSLGEAAREAYPEGWQYWIHEVGGETYHYAYTPVAVLNAPFVWLYETLGISSVTARGFDRAAEVGILRGIAAVLTAALGALLYLLARRFTRPLWSLALVTSFAFGTQLLSTVSRPFWSHAWTLPLMALGLLLLVGETGGRLRAALAASAFALSAAVRPVTALSALAVTWWLWRTNRRRDLPVFIATGAGWALLAMTASWLVLGSWLPPKIAAFHSDWEPGSLLRLYPAGLLGALVSPARGLLVYVPLVLWILWMTFKLRHRIEPRALWLASLGVVFAHWQVLALTRAWPDGQAFGARLFSDILVWLFLLAVLVARTLDLDAASSRRARWAPALLLLALAGSVLVNVRGAVAKETWRWDWLDRPPAWVERGGRPTLHPPRVWNWRYPQFLAGWLPKEVDGNEIRLRFGGEEMDLEAPRPLVPDPDSEESEAR